MAVTAIAEPELIEGAEENAEETESTPRRSPLRFIVWLLIIAVGLFLIPLFLVSTTIREAIPEIEMEITAIAETIGAPVSIPAEQSTLEAELLNVRSAVSVLQQPLQMAGANFVNWPQTMAVIGSYDTLRVTVQRITQNGRQITVNGQAISQTAVTGYADMLRTSGLFTRVVILSIDAVILPTATPAHADEVPPFPSTIANFSLLLELLPPATEAPDATE